MLNAPKKTINSRLSLKHGDIVVFGSDLKNPLVEYNYLSFEVSMPNGETYGTGPRTSSKKRAKSTDATEERSTGELKRHRTDGYKVEKVLQKAAEKALRKAARSQRRKQARQSREREGQQSVASAASTKRQGGKRQGKSNRLCGAGPTQAENQNEGGVHPQFLRY